MSKKSQQSTDILHNEATLRASGYRIVFEPRGSFIDFFHDHSEEILLSACAGTGKAVALDTIIQTPNGPIPMRDVHVGSQVFGKNGKPIDVIWESPILKDRVCYKVIFSDESYVVCDAEHLWTVLDVRLVATKHKTLTTRELQSNFKTGTKGRIKYAIETCEALQYQDKEDLLIVPYVLGCWLGDGDTRDACYTCDDKEILDRIENYGYPITKYRAKYKYRIQELHAMLKMEKVLGHKHIPEKYQQASVPERLELLRGLMDTDGTCDKDQGGCEFYNMNEELARDVYRLVCGLGIKATFKEKRATLNGIFMGICYKVCFTTRLKVFNLTRKLTSQLGSGFRPTQNRRYIKEIIGVPSVPVKCISVNSEDNLYLVSNSCIPTHNSRAALEKVHLILSKYAGARFFMCRKTRSSMTNSCMKTFEKEVLKPPDKVHLLKSEQVYKYPNGSELAIVGLDDPEKIKSTDWDGGYIQEATEVSLHDWEMCTSRLRASLVPYQQLIGDCNPDKPTHWLKLREAQGLLKMFHSTLKDNPKWWDARKQQWTKAGQAYDGKLNRLTGVRRARLYMGLWVAAEGMVYDKWDPLVNMIYKSQLPKESEEWDHYWAIDWGYIHPFAWGEYIQNPHTNQMILINQIYRPGVLVEDHAKEIAKIVDGRVPRAIICDHDAGDRATFERHISKHMGLPLLTLPAYKPIGIGIQNLQRRISADPQWGGGPGLLVVRDSLCHSKDEVLQEAGLPTCFEEEIEGYVWDVKHNEDVNSKKDEIPIDKDNHACDKARYMAAFLDDLAIDPQNFEETVYMNDGFGEMISRY